MKEIKTVDELMAHLEELKHNLTGAKPALDATEEQKKVRAAYAKFGQVGFLLSERVDSKLVLKDAVKALTVAE